MSFVFDLKYLSQNSINFNMLGVFWNPQDEQISKLSLPEFANWLWFDNRVIKQKQYMQLLLGLLYNKKESIFTRNTAETKKI